MASMRLFRRLHQLHQNAAHIPGMHEDDGRAVRADARLAQHLGALRLHLGLGGVDVRHLEADMMLPAARVLRQEAVQRRILSQRLDQLDRSEEHTSELQSLMRISYAVFCLKKKK